MRRTSPVGPVDQRLWPRIRSPSAVAEVTKRWLPADELLARRVVLQQAAGRPNLGPIDKADANEKLAEVELRNRRADAELAPPPAASEPAAQTDSGRPHLATVADDAHQQLALVFLVMYSTDLLLLLLIGKVPLAYNFRYLWVRKRDTLLTALAFTVVVALVVILLAFVNGMYKLNESTGVPGNVLVMSEGSTDELFSNLALQR